MRSETSGMQIIIVSDDAATASSLQRALGQCGLVSTSQFNHPAAALDWCTKDEPGLVLADYFMRAFDGLEFIRRFRALRGCGQIPLLLMHCAAARVIRPEALQLGATDFLTLPFDLPALAARTTNLLALRQAQLQLQKRPWSTLDESGHPSCPLALLH